MKMMMKMKIGGLPLFLLVILLCSSTSLCGTAAAAPHQEIYGCNGTIAECLHQEFLMDSEVSRRLLISFNDVVGNSGKPNKTPCKSRGTPNRECLPIPNVKPDRRKKIYGYRGIN